MKTIKPIAVLSLLLINLSLFAQSALPYIQIDPTDRPQGDRMLSEMVQSIEYIPLETNNKCLIATVRAFDITDNYIIVSCNKSGEVFLFNRKGKFITRIGRTGGGPGEYLQGTARSVFIDEPNRRIILYAGYPNRLMYYDFTGKYQDRLLDKEDEDEYDDGVGMILRYHNNLFLTSHPNSKGRVPYVYALRTSDLKAVSQSIKSVPYEMTDIDNPTATAGVSIPAHYLYNGLIHVKNTSLNDTLYAIGKDYIFRPKYRINAGKYEVTVEAKSQFYKWIEANRNNTLNYLFIHSVFETGTNLLLHYDYLRKYYYACYDKSLGRLLYYQSSNGIPNDYDGGIDFWPKRQDEKTLYAFYDAYLINEQLEEKEKITPKGSPQAVQTAGRILGKIDPEDNPVLVIVTLK